MHWYALQLALVEMRLLLCIIAQLNSKKQLDSTRRCYLHAQTYAEMFGIQQDGAYQLLKEAIDSLIQTISNNYNILLILHSLMMKISKQKPSS